MGVNNRQRREAKKKKRQGRGQPFRSEPPRRERSAADGHLEGVQAARDGVRLAAEAFRFEAEASYGSWLDALRAVGQRTGPRIIHDAVTWWIERGLDRAWESGWQPADVMRSVRRSLGSRHADAVGAAVAASGGRRPETKLDDRWAAQVSAIPRGRPAGLDLGPAGNLALAVEVVSLLLHLAPLPRLSMPASEPRRAGDGSGAMLERVRALLAKAESTTFPEEADALTAKAQELMARHAIDAAMLDPARAGGTSVGGWRIGIDDPYAAAKSLLLDRIACANRCSAVWCTNVGFSTVFGARSDLEMVELLFTSLLVQATEAMLRAGRSVDHYGRSRTTSFRKSFLVAYAIRIGERLAATTASVVAEGAEQHGDALLPVLASRAEAVEDAVREAFPDTVSKGTAVSNHSGWLAGRAAADMASLRVADELAAG